MKRCVFALVSLLLPFMSLAQDNNASPIAPGATLQQLADGFIFTEGPACDADGNVYFTDQPNDRIMLWSRDGKLSTFMQGCGRSNGLCFDGAGNLIACADENNQLWLIDVKTKEHAVLVKDYNGHRLNGPNDVFVMPDGGMYFTDPLYPREYWRGRSAKTQQNAEGVYYLSPDHKTLKRVVQDMTRPNGIIGTADGKTLYVSDLDGSKTWSFHPQADGSLADKTLFCKLGSDGMTIDDAGNVYLTGHGVTVFDSSGKKVAHIDIKQEWTGNICFAGKGSHTLFITASKAIYGIQTKTAGVVSQ
jgi:gluconolactonase